MIKIRSLFISDLHLGSPHSHPEMVLNVFKKYEFDNLFIVGDFIDLISLKRKFFWNPDHSAVIQKVLKMSRKGVNVIYIIGNHDAYIRDLIDESNIHIGDILLCNEYVHTTLNDEKIYITHGDIFDGFLRVHPFFYWLGGAAYDLSARINKVYNYMQKKLASVFGYEFVYWSVSAYLKSKVKNLIQVMNEYEKMSDQKVKEMKCHSILIGHTHIPKMIYGKYYNTGDFVESGSYIIEDLYGNMQLLRI
jgi:UDP-2,3-diacylglucosamine pyrophosphatase LpxH